MVEGRRAGGRERTRSEVGTVQGGSISPLLANVYLHYVFDLWVQRWRRREARGDVIVVRFADDFVVGFEHREEAERFLADLRERFARFGLALHPDKTRLIEFGRFADRNRRGAWRRETGDLQLPRLHARVQPDAEGTVHGAAADDAPAVAGEAARGEDRAAARLHAPIPVQGAYLRAVVVGHTRYYGVPRNGPRLGRVPPPRSAAVARPLLMGAAVRPGSCRGRACAAWWRAGSLGPRICHPYPNQRLAFVTQGRSRMR
jgi:RNA-directed DNA polymerase